jgi:FkbM family methyltransferase
MEVSGRSETSVDVGSYTGLFSIIGALSGAKVIAFEPNRYVYNRMKANIERNQLKDLVTLNPVALGDATSYSRSLIPRNQFYSSGFQLELSPTERDLSGWVMSEPVYVSTLDFELCDLNSSVGALKIDAEGFELEILQGGKHLLIDHKPTIFLECLSSDRLEQCISYITSLEIQIQSIDYVDKDHNNYIIYLV